MIQRPFLSAMILVAALAGSARADLIGFYSFNGNAADSSGNGNNGTVNGTVGYTNNGPFGGLALTLDGSSKNNYVSVPISSTVAGQPTETFGAWVYVPAGVNMTTIEGIISNDDGSFDRTLDLDTRNTGFQYGAFNGAGPVAGGSVTTGQWVFLAVSYDNSGGNNGTYIFQVGGTQLTGSTSFDGNSVAALTYIGINPNFDFEFHGEIADAFFYNTALTGAQLNNIEANGPSAILGGGTSAPEPSGIALLGTGLAILGGAARGRRRRQ